MNYLCTYITKICMGWSLQIFRFYIFMRLISGTGKKLSELTAPLNKYFHSGEINFHVDNKEKILSNLRAKYSDGQVVEMDGFYVEYPTWWFNVRVSNTEPVLRLNLEANTREEMAKGWRR